MTDFYTDPEHTPATYTPLLKGVTWPALMTVTQEEYLRYTWNGGEGFGTYHLLIGWTVPNSLQDGVINDGDLVALGWVAVSLRRNGSVATRR